MSSVPTYCEMFTTKEISETSDDRTRVHRVGPFVPVNAVMMWGAAVALLITVVAMSSAEWAVQTTIHVGLWRICVHSVCLTSTDFPIIGKHYQTGN